MSATFDRLIAANPDRVGRSGYWADLDGYHVAVWNDGGKSRWDLSTADRKFIVGGRADTVDAAWRAGCDAIDEQHQQLADYQLTEQDVAELAKARERASKGRANLISWSEAKLIIDAEADR